MTELLKTLYWKLFDDLGSIDPFHGVFNNHVISLGITKNVF